VYKASPEKSPYIIQIDETAIAIDPEIAKEIYIKGRLTDDIAGITAIQEYFLQQGFTPAVPTRPVNDFSML
jgi:hypothetical protein